MTTAKWVVGRPSGTGEPDSVKQFEGKPYQEYGQVHTEPDPVTGYRKGIAHVYQGEGGVGSPQALAEQKANATLIAAAPELLRYLKRVTEDIGFESMSDLTAAEALIRHIEEA